MRTAQAKQSSDWPAGTASETIRTAPEFTVYTPAFGLAAKPSGENETRRASQALVARTAETATTSLLASKGTDLTTRQEILFAVTSHPTMLL